MRILLIAATLLFGCASTIEFAPIDWQAQDQPEKSQISITYRNTTEKTLCFTQDDWPNAAGKINSVDIDVALIIGGKRFPMNAYDTGYCPTGCSLRVSPRQEISGFFKYEDFNLPENLYKEEKELEFAPNVEIC